MTSVTCPSCHAHFEVDFEPGTRFACGDCAATVTVPPLPVIQPVRFPPDLRPEREVPSPALRLVQAEATAGRRRPLVLWAAVATSVLALGILLLLLVKSKDVPAPPKPPPAPVIPPEPPPPPDPYALARTKAREVGSLDALLHFGDLAWNRSVEAERKDDSGAIKAARAEWRWAYREVVRQDPEHRLARERLGDTLYDPARVEELGRAPWLPDDVKTDLSLISDSIAASVLEGRPQRTWLQRQDQSGRDWAALWARIEKYRKIEEGRKTDPFYPEAEALGRKVVEELSNSTLKVSFRRDGVEGEAFQVLVRKPYAILVQRETSGDEKKIADEWAQVLEDLQVTFYAKFGEETGLPPMDLATPVIVLRDLSEYFKYLVRGLNPATDRLPPVQSSAHYEPSSNRLVCFMKSGEDERSTLFHEGTHQIIEFATKTAGTRKGLTQSLWFSEGIADYFGGHGMEWDEEMHRCRYIPGRINKERIEMLAEAKAAGTLFPLAELLEYRRRDYERDRVDKDRYARTFNGYCQGWALVYLLNEWKDGKYRKDFDENMNEEFDGRSGMATFEKVFGKYGLDNIEKELLEMIQELRVALREHRIVSGKLLPRGK